MIATVFPVSDTRIEDDEAAGAKIRRRTLGKTNRDRLAQAFAAVPANVLAGARAHPAEDSGKYVVHQVDEIRLVVVTAVDLAEIVRDSRVGGTCGLAGNVLAQPIHVLGLVGEAVLAREREVRHPVAAGFERENDVLVSH